MEALGLSSLDSFFPDENSRALLWYRLSVRNLFKIHIVLIQSIYLSCEIVLKFCPEHGRITAGLWAKSQNDLTTGQ